jgi:hypothetical protein
MGVVDQPDLVRLASTREALARQCQAQLDAWGVDAADVPDALSAASAAKDFKSRHGRTQPLAG